MSFAPVDVEPILSKSHTLPLVFCEITEYADKRERVSEMKFPTKTMEFTLKTLVVTRYTKTRKHVVAHTL